jgi:hypothetical protein
MGSERHGAAIADGLNRPVKALTPRCAPVDVRGQRAKCQRLDSAATR